MVAVEAEGAEVVVAEEVEVEEAVVGVEEEVKAETVREIDSGRNEVEMCIGSGGMIRRWLKQGLRDFRYCLTLRWLIVSLAKLAYAHCPSFT